MGKIDGKSLGHEKYRRRLLNSLKLALTEIMSHCCFKRVSKLISAGEVEYEVERSVHYPGQLRHH